MEGERGVGRAKKQLRYFLHKYHSTSRLHRDISKSESIESQGPADKSRSKPTGATSPRPLFSTVFFFKKGTLYEIPTTRTHFTQERTSTSQTFEQDLIKIMIFEPNPTTTKVTKSRMIKRTKQRNIPSITHTEDIKRRRKTQAHYQDNDVAKVN